MRVMVVSNTGGGLGLAQFLTQEGHSVKVCLKPTDLHSVEEQFMGDQPDIAFFDDNGYVVPAEWVRVRGIRVLGPTKWSNLLEAQSEYNKQFLSAAGLAAAPALTGTETPVTVCGWFNGNKFIARFLAFNYQHMMAGNVGAQVQSAGYLAYFPEECALIDRVLEPMERFLRKANHRGCFSIDVVADSKGEVYGVSASANSNLPYTNAVYENTRKAKGDLVLAMFDPTSVPVPIIEPYVCGVMLSVYPYPYTAPATPLEVLGLNPANQKHMWQMDIAKADDKMVCGQLSGNAGYVTAHGKTVQEAQRRVYRTIANLNIQGLQYRNDIAKDAVEKIYKLRSAKLLPHG